MLWLLKTVLISSGIVRYNMSTESTIDVKPFTTTAIDGADDSDD